MVKEKEVKADVKEAVKEDIKKQEKKLDPSAEGGSINEKAKIQF